MRKQPLTLTEIKTKISSLKGKEVNLTVNRGRNRIVSFDAVVENTYNSVFTVRNLQKMLDNATLTYSYNDVLCGDVAVDTDK